MKREGQKVGNEMKVISLSCKFQLHVNKFIDQCVKS